MYCTACSPRKYKMPVEKELVREGEAARFSEQFASAVEAHQTAPVSP